MIEELKPKPLPFFAKNDMYQNLEETIEIKRTAIVPKGDLCLWCQYVGEEITPKMCAMNGVLSSFDTNAVCKFFNQPLIESDVVDDRCPCNPKKYYKKCFGCATANMTDEEKAIIEYVLRKSFEKALCNKQEDNSTTKK